MEAIPVNTVIVDEMFDPVKNKNYYAISYKVGNVENYRVGSFKTKEEAEIEGEKILKTLLE
jgi:hypothetical protein